MNKIQERLREIRLASPFGTPRHQDNVVWMLWLIETLRYQNKVLKKSLLELQSKKSGHWNDLLQDIE